MSLSRKQQKRIKGILQLVNANNFTDSFNHSTENSTGIHLVKVTRVVDHSNHHDQIQFDRSSSPRCNIRKKL